MKTLKQLLESKKPSPTVPYEKDSETSLTPKAPDEKRFKDKHVVDVKQDVAGNKDDVYKASNVKAYNRSASNHGYNTGEDQKVYESKTLSAILGERHMTPAEKKKREEIAQGIEKSNPDMPMSKKMAIATSKAMKEGYELFDVFAEDIRQDVQTVFESLNEENQQVMIEMIETGEYDAVVEIVKEIVNG